MMVTDPIADMLTRVRNAVRAKHETVDIPASKEKLQIAEILKKEGYIEGYEVNGEDKKTITITLKYVKNGQVISGLKRVSKPGLRVYAQADKLPRVLNGLGIAIISTSKGVMTDKDAKALHVGGEVLAYIW
ncbi:MAG: 30S ribosomal protein S8 [Erysipelotrichales bacterium]|nr:30S ribosomal protein S8 [Erysipelotrichales bacterium]MBQ1386340.1 30S ribosomal protein S8 [Erysipelotrichales bacterium]MBQ2309080.1 30S ribosomal protein S8 [Erysipelotrichales bacterium]MBQ2479141.1 30S ribosomal protein S8 [Erysipelotrichales bacterium]MBQ4012006.1 30S ribosomal protein S8 [Erysipelotrichales bacterium]